MKLNQIITSLLETDMYKFSMGQTIFHQFTDYKTTWTFKCRNEEEYKETIHFYKDVLGLTVARSWETGTMLDTGEGLIEIFNNGEDPKEQGVIRHFALETEDVESCVRVVREAGYEVFIEPKDIVIASELPFPASVKPRFWA